MNKKPELQLEPTIKALKLLVNALGDLLDQIEENYDQE